MPTKPTPPPTRAAQLVARWQPAVSLSVVAAVLVALVGSAWYRGVWGDGGDDPGTTPVGGLVNQEGTPDAPAIDPALLPRAEDCTVEPLTVDEVIAYVSDPSGVMNSIDASAGPTSATPVPPVQLNQGPAAATTIQDVAEDQRMWMSCTLTDSWFHIWATEAPWLVQQQVLNVVGPVISKDELRAVLTRLHTDGPATPNADWTRGEFLSPSAIGLVCGGPIALVDTDLENSWQSVEPAKITLAPIVYDLEGNVVVPPSTIFGLGPGTPVSLQALEGQMIREDVDFQFVYDVQRERWLVRAIPLCG